MLKDLWNEYWADKGNHDWWKNPSPEVLQVIEGESPELRPNILDLGCGLGRHSIAFARAGFRVTAIDTSPEAVSHLEEWASSFALPVQTKVCDIIHSDFTPGTFDKVLSYNVIYHGSREQFAAAIMHVSCLLRSGGRFFFTCPTRRDGKYGHGEQVAPHTYLCTKSITPGDIHYFADDDDLDELLHDFRMILRQVDEGYWDNKGTQQFYSNWIILVEKY